MKNGTLLERVGFCRKSFVGGGLVDENFENLEVKLGSIDGWMNQLMDGWMNERWYVVPALVVSNRGKAYELIFVEFLTIFLKA
jgi:hypothetical protein